MKVVPIASTVLHLAEIDEETDYQPHFWTQDVRDPDELAELAGRNCYQSWDRPHPKTATNQGYLKNILSQGHYSVLEHASVTFYVEGVSRALLAELTRHRHLSFSVVSQRYVDANSLSFVYPPILNELPQGVRDSIKAEMARVDSDALIAYDNIVSELIAEGYKRKEAREAARAVLPNSTESPMVVTGNLRAWRDVLGKRHHVAADKEIQAFAREVLRHLRDIAPNSVQDIPDAPYA